jgi:uncharacterized protein
MAADPKPQDNSQPHSHRPPAFQIMLKPRGPICNLDCDYCFYLSKENLYPNGTFRMPDSLLEETTRQYIDAQQGREVTFAWQGGEPTLMGLDFFQKAVEYQQKYSAPGKRVTNSFQTNGVLVNEDWCRFFHDHHFLIGLSLDGPQDIHDTYRVDKGGSPTWEKVMAALDHLKTFEVEFNTLTCVHATNQDRGLDVYHFLRDEAESRFMQFIPVVERDGAGVTERSVTGAGYGRFLTSIFDEWVRRDGPFRRCLMSRWRVSGDRPGLCVFDDTCGAALAMEHNGDVYACDHFVAPDTFLGNMQDSNLIDLVSSEQQWRFGQDKRDSLPRQCRECEVRFVCNGGCPKDRLLTTQDGESGLNVLCEGYYAFFKHITLPIRIMANELRARRPPANVMYMLAREEAIREQQAVQQFAHVGRNDPCPCRAEEVQAVSRAAALKGRPLPSTPLHGWRGGNPLSGEQNAARRQTRRHKWGQKWRQN